MGLRKHGWTLAFVAAALLGGDLFAMTHAIVVAHDVCAEHGEPIHVSPESDAVEAPRSLVGAVTSAAPSASSPDDHDHCTLGGGTRRAGPPSRGPVVARSIHEVAPLAGTGIALDPAIPLFRLAPKNSPPVTR